MNEIQLKLCDIQGRLFELSVDRQIGSTGFVKSFMNSETAKALDSTYNRMQWAGEEYLLEEVIEAAGDNSDTTKYEDHFTSSSSLIAISKSGRSISSEYRQNCC